MNDNPMITASNGEPIRFDEYLKRAAAALDCPPKEALEKLIDTAHMDATTADKLRELANRLFVE